MITLTQFEIPQYLQSEEDMAEYLSAVWESGNVDAIIAALGDIAEAKGIDHLATIISMDKKNINEALFAGTRPHFDTIYRIMKGLGISIQTACSPAAAATAAR